MFSFNSDPTLKTKLVTCKEMSLEPLKVLVGLDHLVTGQVGPGGHNRQNYDVHTFYFTNYRRTDTYRNDVAPRAIVL